MSLITLVKTFPANPMPSGEPINMFCQSYDIPCPLFDRGISDNDLMSENLALDLVSKQVSTCT